METILHVFTLDAIWCFKFRLWCANENKSSFDFFYGKADNRKQTAELCKQIAELSKQKAETSKQTADHINKQLILVTN